MEQTTIKPDLAFTVDALILSIKSIELALRDMDSKDPGVRANIDRITACLEPFRGNVLR